MKQVIKFWKSELTDEWNVDTDTANKKIDTRVFKGVNGIKEIYPESGWGYSYLDNEDGLAHITITEK